MNGSAGRTKATWRSAATAAALAGILVLAGCTSDPEATGTSAGPSQSSGTSATGSTAGSASTGATRSSTGGSSSSSAAPTLPSGVTPGALPTAPSNVPDKRKGVAVTSCAQTAGGWGASGTAINTGDKDVEYSITIFFTTDAATTIDFASTKVTVAPGKTAEWTAAKKFKAADTMLCVLRAVS